MISYARYFAAGLLAFVLCGCSSVNFTDTRAGTFSGNLYVMWVGEGDSSGDGLFLFVPDPDNPLTFYRPDRTSVAATIRPGLMYTDGGSIPKFGQVFNGFSPWGYAPAYMIHDWLFTARHCLVDGRDTDLYKDMKDVDFDTSARILGEGIHTLMETHRVKENDFSGSIITMAVDSAVARQLWDRQGACQSVKVRPEHVAAAEAFFAANRKQGRMDAAGHIKAFQVDPQTPVVRPRQRAKIIAQVRF